MKTIVQCLIFILIVSGAMAQDTDMSQKDRSEFIISGNLSSGVSLVSLGFEKLFFLKPNLTLAAKAGFGYNQEFTIFAMSTQPTNYFILPHHLTCNFGSSKSFLEMGVGASWVSGGHNNYYLVYPILGYRYHPFNNPGFSFRIWAYFPFGQEFITDYNEVLFAPIGVSFGIAL